MTLLVPKIRPGLGFQVHSFDGVDDMLNKLPSRLQGYSDWLPEDWRIVVVRDQDREDCRELKREIETIVRRAGLTLKRTGKAAADYQVVIRIAVEELEAWLFGDVAALAKTYPGISPTLVNRKGYRDPDAIKGGTWEALERELQRAGYFLGGLPKIQVAREVSANMDPDVNVSRSFAAFRDALRQM